MVRTYDIIWYCTWAIDISSGSSASQDEINLGHLLLIVPLIPGLHMAFPMFEKKGFEIITSCSVPRLNIFSPLLLHRVSLSSCGVLRGPLLPLKFPSTIRSSSSLTLLYMATLFIEKMLHFLLLSNYHCWVRRRV